jgi:N-acetylglucosaminyldiphosphoundecaprenol N-acetyl-beta-D-mannosaminyltransferase
VVKAMKIYLCGIRIDSYSFKEVVELIINHALFDKKPEYVVTPNAHHIVTLQDDFYFQEIYRNSFLSVSDGVPLLWAAKFLGTPLQGRVNGTDLFERLCAVGAEKGLKIFLLGGRPGAAEQAAQVLQHQHPNLKISGTYCPPYGFENDAREREHINNLVKTASPDILFVGLGAPKQEKWIYENYRQLAVPVSIGIGVSFELVSNMVTRAPVVMQRLGLEWLFRLLVEPRRLWKRYVLGNTIFVWLVIKQRLGILKN